MLSVCIDTAVSQLAHLEVIGEVVVLAPRHSAEESGFGGSFRLVRGWRLRVTLFLERIALGDILVLWPGHGEVR
jgi:hypothetical protein